MSRRSMSPEFDPRIADWLEDDPDDAPDAVLTTVLAAFPSIPQRRTSRVPWRTRPMTMTARLVAAAIAFAVVAVGGAIILRPGGSNVAASPSPSPLASVHATGSPAPSRPASSAGLVDYSGVPGRILIEHAGNAPDGSEDASDYHIDRRRLYWMDPSTMTGATAVELLPGWTGNGTGKGSADISPDGKTIVFQETGTDYPQLWTTSTTPAGIQLAETGPAGNRCVHVPKCGEFLPAFGPNGMLAYVVDLNGTSWIQVDGPSEGQERELRSTRGPDSQPGPDGLSVSPDGSKIAFYRTTWDGDTPRSARISVVDVATDTTTVLPIPLTFPGDPHWSPDGSRILLTDGPLSMAAVPLGQADRTAEVYSVAPDGSGLFRITNTRGNAITADYTADGRVIFFNNYFWLVNADGTDPRPVNLRGDDLSEQNVGFAYIGHWIEMAP